LHDLTSPVGQFVRERCAVGPDYEVARADLYQAYLDWAHANGRKRPEDAAGFGRALRAAVPDVEDAQRRIEGQPTRLYVGVGFPPL